MTNTEVESLITKTVREAVAQAAEVLRQPQREYLDTIEAADYIGISTVQLEIWRSHGDGPCYCKLSRLVRYKRSDLDAWMLARRRSNTAESR